MHLKSHYGTNEDKCFYKHSIDMTLDILIQFLRKEEKSVRTQLCPDDWSLLVTSRCKAQFSFGISLFKTIYRTDWDGNGENDLNSMAYDRCARQKLVPVKAHGASVETRCLPRFLWHTCGFESGAVVQHLKVSWHILLCLHATHPNQGTWGSHSRVSSLFSEVTQTRGQCTQFQGDFRRVGGLPKKNSNITQTPVETRLWQQVCMRATSFFFTLSPSFSASQQLHLCQSFVWSSSADARVASVHVISVQRATKTVRKKNNFRKEKRAPWKNRHENELYSIKMWMKRKCNMNSSLSDVKTS